MLLHTGFPPKTVSRKASVDFNIFKAGMSGPSPLNWQLREGQELAQAKSESEVALVSSQNSSPEHSLPSSSPVSADQREFSAEDRRRDRAGSEDVAGPPGELGRAHASAAGDKSALLTASFHHLLPFLPLTTENSAAPVTPAPPIHTSSLKLPSVVSANVLPKTSC